MASRYKKIILKDGTRQDEHRMVMEKHLKRKLETDEFVHHINNDPRDNRIENLDVMSRAEHGRLHAPSAADLEYLHTPNAIGKSIHSGLGNHHHKLTQAQVVDIVKRIRSGQSQRNIAAEFNIKRHLISDIMQGRSWCWFTGITKAGELGTSIQ